MRLLLKLNSSRVHCQLRVAMTEARGQLRNPKEEERPSLEAVTRGPIKRKQTVKNQCVL
jgi:hypothetical protein